MKQARGVSWNPDMAQCCGTQVPLPPLLRRNVQRCRGGLVFKAHRLVYHSTLGLRLIEKKKEGRSDVALVGLHGDAGRSITTHS